MSVSASARGVTPPAQPTVTWERNADGEFLPWGIPFGTDYLRCISLMEERGGLTLEDESFGEDGSILLYDDALMLWGRPMSGYVFFFGGGLDYAGIYWRGKDSDYLDEAAGTEAEAQPIYTCMAAEQLSLFAKAKDAFGPMTGGDITVYRQNESYHYTYPFLTGAPDARRLAELFAQGGVVNLRAAFGNVIVSLDAYTSVQEGQPKPRAYKVSVHLTFLSKMQVEMTPCCYSFEGEDGDFPFAAPAK